MDINFKPNDSGKLSKNDKNINEANLKGQPKILKSGEIIKGTIVDIQRNNIFVKINNQVIQARINELISVEIGSIQEFKIDYDENLNLKLIFKMPTAEEVKKNMLIETLQNFSIKPDKLNIDIAKKLMDNGLPVTKENFQKMSQGLRIIDQDVITKTLFFIENDMPINNKNLNFLNNLLDGKASLNIELEKFINGFEHLDNNIKESIYDILLKNDTLGKQNIDTSLNNELIKNPKELSHTKIELENNQNDISKNDKQLNNLINNLENNDIELLKSKIFQLSSKLKFNYDDLNDLLSSNKLMKEFDIKLDKNNIVEFLDEVFKDENINKFIVNRLGEREASTKLNFVKDKFMFNHNNSNLQNMENFFDEFRKNINDIEKFIASQPKTSENIKLYNELHNIKENIVFNSNIKSNFFFQIPININQNSTNTELFVFKDKNKKKKTNKDSISALIALDTKNIGRIEIFVQKESKSVSLNFKLKDEKMKKLANDNVGDLLKNLEGLNYSIANLTFSTFKEKFKVIDNKDKLMDIGLVLDNDKIKMNFDIRV